MHPRFWEGGILAQGEALSTAKKIIQRIEIIHERREDVARQAAFAALGTDAAALSSHLTETSFETPDGLPT